MEDHENLAALANAVVEVIANKDLDEDTVKTSNKRENEEDNLEVETKTRFKKNCSIIFCR